MSVLPAFMPVHHACACLPRQARRGWPEKVLDPLGPELQTAVSCYLSAENGTGGSLEEQSVLKLLSHLASPTLEGFLKNPICFSLSRSQFVIKGQGGLTVRSTLLATPFSVTSCVFKREKRCTGLLQFSQLRQRAVCSSPVYLVPRESAPSRCLVLPTICSGTRPFRTIENSKSL